VIASLTVASLLGTFLPLALPGKSLSRAYMDFFPYTIAAVVLTFAALAVAFERDARRD
jgi:hypothetical protein